jgi:hypothetical protein
MLRWNNSLLPGRKGMKERKKGGDFLMRAFKRIKRWARYLNLMKVWIYPKHNSLLLAMIQWGRHWSLPIRVFIRVSVELELEASNNNCYSLFLFEDLLGLEVTLFTILGFNTTLSQVWTLNFEPSLNPFVCVCVFLTRQN